MAVTAFSMRLGYKYKQVVYELDALWGVKLIRPVMLRGWLILIIRVHAPFFKRKRRLCYSKGGAEPS